MMPRHDATPWCHVIMPRGRQSGGTPSLTLGHRPWGVNYWASTIEEAKHMSGNDDLLALSSVELRRRIGRKDISPVELMEAAIARIAALNPAVNAICATAFSRACCEAKAAEKAALEGEPLGPLHGLPTGIKDLHDAEGLLTTQGSPLYRDHIAASDCGMVANMRRAGAIVVAKTNVPEFGAGANTRNP